MSTATAVPVLERRLGIKAAGHHVQALGHPVPVYATELLRGLEVRNTREQGTVRKSFDAELLGHVEEPPGLGAGAGIDEERHEVDEAADGESRNEGVTMGL